MTDTPKPQTTYKTHKFTAGIEWTGERTWSASSKECPSIKGAPATVFGGSDDLWDPEVLMLTAVNSCHLSSFISYTKRKNFEFVSYTAEIEGLLEHDGTTFRFTKMVLRPMVKVKTEEDIETAIKYLNRAHEICFMGHSVNAEVTIEPDVAVE